MPLLRLRLQKRREERAKQHKWQSDRLQYGKTEGGKYVDQQSLEQLVSLGYEMPLAAEALRQVSSSYPLCKIQPYIITGRSNGGSGTYCTARQGVGLLQTACEYVVEHTRGCSNTEGGKYVDQQSVEQLVSLGYELPLAAAGKQQLLPLQGTAFRTDGAVECAAWQVGRVLDSTGIGCDAQIGRAGGWREACRTVTGCRAADRLALEPFWVLG